MRNKLSMKLFIILFLCTFFIFSFSHFGSKAFQAMMNDDSTFTDGTMIGIVDVSEKTENEAIQKVDEELTKWLDNTVNQLYFREKSIILDNALFRFEIEETIKAVTDGQKNEVLVHIDEDAFEESMRQHFPSVSKNEFDVEKLYFDLMKNAKILQSGAFDFSLEDYFVSESLLKEEVIAESMIQLDNASSALSLLTSKVSKIEILPESQFSLISFLTENGLEDESPTLHNALASGIYELVLQTNFSIMERHISNEKPEFAKLGFEARINLEKYIDLSFANKNRTSYFIELKQNGDYLQLLLTGRPFLNQYVISTEDEEVFKPKTIKQYNPLLKKGQKIVEKQGKDGVLISVVRTVYDEKGERLKQETISEDFYPPTPQIEVHALIDKASSQTGTTQPEINNEQNESGTSEEDSTDEGDVSEKENDGTFNSDHDLWGKQTEQMK